MVVMMMMKAERQGQRLQLGCLLPLQQTRRSKERRSPELRGGQRASFGLTLEGWPTSSRVPQCLAMREVWSTKMDWRANEIIFDFHETPVASVSAVSDAAGAHKADSHLRSWSWSFARAFKQWPVAGGQLPIGHAQN